MTKRRGAPTLPLELDEARPCPYCRARFEKRPSFRAHVVLNRCGNVPPDVAASVMIREARELLEVEFQTLVMAYAEDAGWLTCHVRRSIMSDGRILTATSSPGFPDLTLVRPPLVVFLELKREKGSKASPEQNRWIRTIQECGPGAEAYVVKPSDWRAIASLLDART